MDISKFNSNKTGRIVPISGVQGLKHAFIPDLLPPKWKWPNHLWPLLVDARAALASLHGVGRHLPNPDLVLRPLQNREAQRSSSLEGTYTDPQQQALFQIDPKMPSSIDDPLNAQREVFNYGRALRHRFDHDELPLSLRLIRELHALLMEGVRGHQKDPGNFRRVQNQVGRPPRYVPPPVNYLADLLDNFEKYLHRETPFDPLVNAFIVHYQFEAIHPFLDGNGRVGRLLLSISIAEWCGLSNQWLYMSDYFDKNKDTYIDTLFYISAKGKWEEWISFCLEGTILQAKDTEDRCIKLLELNKSFHDKVKEIGGSYRLNSIIDELFDIPVLQIPRVARKHQVQYGTAKSDLRKLELAGIITELPNLPQKTFYCPSILEITYQD